MTTPNAFGPADRKDRSRELYVGNEADTDEYGEAQPAKLLALVGGLVGEMEHKDQITLAGLLAVWLAAVDGSRYGGADQSAPVFTFIHDWLWDRGQHPYCETFAEWQETDGDDE